MSRARHPVTGDTYELTDDGPISVTREGQTGYFRANGEWISGGVRNADPLYCVWFAAKHRHAMKLKLAPKEGAGASRHNPLGE